MTLPRGYVWLYIQELLLVVLGKSYGMLSICVKENALPHFTITLASGKANFCRSVSVFPCEILGFSLYEGKKNIGIILS